MTDRLRSAPERAVFRRELAAIGLVYTAAWGLLLSAAGRYWDDWAALDLSARAVSEWSRQQGLFWQLDFLRVLSALPGTERIGHALVFVLYLICALALHRVLREVPGMSALARTAMPALFAVFPVNAARYALVDLMYAISLAVFMAAWWLIAVDLDEPRIWRKLLVAALLLFAMLSTASLMMLVIVIPASVMWARARDWRDASARTTLASRYGFLLGLPVVAWLIRAVTLQPSGVYAKYNQLTLKSAWEAVGMVPEAFGTSIAGPIRTAFSSHIGVTLALGVAIFALASAGRWATDREARESWTAQLAMVGAGALLFVLAVFPYLAVGKMPGPFLWHSRHQLLVPFAAAMLIYAVASLVVRLLRLGPRALFLVLSLLLAAFVLANVRTSLAYQADWYKQVSLMQRMGASQDVRQGGYFVFADRVPDLNAARRPYSFYQYNGMMRRVFGDTTRFGIDATQVDIYDPLVWGKHEQYNCWQYEPTSKRYLVTITRGATEVRKPLVVLDLMWREMFAPDEFDRRVGDVVRIETRRAPVAAD